MAADGSWLIFSFPSSFWIYVLTFFAAVCLVSSSFRFYVKWFLFGSQFAFLSILAAIVSLCSPGSASNLHRAARYFLWTTNVWGIRFNIKGKENMKAGSNYVIMCNHQSSFDMVPMFHVFPPNTRILSKIEIYYTPFIGSAAWLGGVIFVDRKNHNNAMSVMNKAVNQIKKEKCNVWVFPEGTRNQGDTLLPFRKGGFHLAVQAEVPILPIVFSDYRPVFDYNAKHFTTGTVQVTILPEIVTKDLKASDVNELMENVRTIMCKEYETSKTVAD